MGKKQQLSFLGEKIPGRTRGRKGLSFSSCPGKGHCFPHSPLRYPSLSALITCALIAAGLKLSFERQPVCCTHDVWQLASKVWLLLL